MDGSEVTTASTLSITDLFFESLPYYLSIGMTADEFWNGDYRLATAYRKADEIRLKRQNYMAYLQGLYVYERVGNLSPLLGFNMSKRKKDHEPIPYRTEPIPITKDELNEYKRHQQELKEEKMKAKFKEFISNMRIEGGYEDANND